LGGTNQVVKASFQGGVLEDKAVNSVFDCWLEVLPRKAQVAAPPKLGNLKSKSRFVNSDAVDWQKIAFDQNCNWKPFFQESNISNYHSFFNDIAIIKDANIVSISNFSILESSNI